MENEYIIINKTAIQKRIKELKFQREREPDNYTQSYLDGKIKQINEVLSQSTPLIPEIEKAYNEGFYSANTDSPVKDPVIYISNLKLDI